MYLRYCRRFVTDSTIKPLSEAIIRLPWFLEFYRPVIHYTEDLIQSIVTYTGIPWWLSISLLTVSIKVTNLPLLYLQFRSMAPLSTAMPNYRLFFEVSKHSKTSAFKKLSCFFTSVRQINKAHNTKFLKSFTYAFIQIPQFLTFIWGIRALCVRNEELVTGGIFWFKDLTQADPLMILPFVSMGLTYINLQLGVTEENKDWMINRMKGYVQIWVILTLPITVHWPAGVFCYWLTNSTFSLIQSLIIHKTNLMLKINPEIREQLIQVYSKSVDQETSERLTKLITTGIEGYSKTTEKQVLSTFQTYLKLQKKLQDEKIN